MADTRPSRIVVIGLGRFGRALTLALEQRSLPVLGIDRDRDLVQSLAESVREVVVADATAEAALEQLGVGPRTRVVIAMADLQSSLLTMILVSRLGAPEVWAKASSPTHAKILRRLGAHHVIQPEHEMGSRVSHLLTGRMQDYLEFEDDFAFAKTSVPPFAVDVPLGESAIRTHFGVTVVAVKRPGEPVEYATAATVPRTGDLLIVSGRTGPLELFAQAT